MNGEQTLGNGGRGNIASAHAPIWQGPERLSAASESAGGSGHPGADRRHRRAQHGHPGRDPLDASVFCDPCRRFDRPASRHPAARSRSLDRRSDVVLRGDRHQAPGRQRQSRGGDLLHLRRARGRRRDRRGERPDRYASLCAAAGNDDRRQRDPVRADVLGLDRRVGAVAAEDGRVLCLAAFCTCPQWCGSFCWWRA